MSAVTLNC